MARRKKESPAPLTIKLFWVGAVLVVIILGPLLLMRANWMWAENAPDEPQIRTSDLESAQDRMRIDLLQDRAHVAHVYVPSDQYAPLSAQFEANGWTAAVASGTKGIERSEEEQGAELAQPTLWFRSQPREGLVARQYAYLEPYARETSSVAWGRFARAAAGHAPVRVEPLLGEETQKAILVGGGSHLTVFMGGQFELPILGHLVPAPSATARAHAIFAPLELKSVEREMKRTGSFPMSVQLEANVAARQVCDAVGDWLQGGMPS